MNSKKNLPKKTSPKTKREALRESRFLQLRNAMKTAYSNSEKELKEKKQKADGRTKTTINIALTERDLKGLLKQKYPQDYKQLVKDGKLDEWAAKELDQLNKQLQWMAEQNPEANADQLRELVLEPYM